MQRRADLKQGKEAAEATAIGIGTPTLDMVGLVNCRQIGEGEEV